MTTRAAGWALIYLLIVLIIACAVIPARAAPLIEQSIASPVRSNAAGSTIWAPHGSAFDAIQPYTTPTADGKVYVYVVRPFFVTGTSTITTFAYDRAPYRPNWTLAGAAWGPDGKTYLSVLGIYGRIHQYVYDPVAQTMPQPPAISPNLDGSNNHNIVIGCDGNVWHCARDKTTGRVGVVRYGINDGRTTEWLGIGPAQALTITNGVASDGDWIYYCSGRSPYVVGAYHIASGRDLTLGSSTYGLVKQLRYGAECAFGGAGYWLWNGKLYAKSQYAVPPWPGGSTAPEEEWATTEKPPSSNDDLATPLADGRVTWTYKQGTASVRATWTVPGVTPDVSRVDALPDGRVMATSGAYLGQWFYTPSSSATAWYGPDGDMSAYATSTSGYSTYIVGYGNGRCHRYQTNVPWTTGTLRSDGTLVGSRDVDANPRFVFACKSLTPPMPIDALTSSAIGPDGRLWAVGQDRRSGATNGVRVIYDPKTGAVDATQEPYAGQATDYVRSTPEGSTPGYVVISGHRVTDASGNKPPSGLLFVYRASGELERTIAPVAGAKAAGNVVCFSATQAVGITEEPGTSTSAAYRVNLATGVVEQRVVLPWVCPFNFGAQGEAAAWSLGPDGRIYTFGGKTLYRINPLDLTQRTEVGTVTAPGQIAWWGKDIYLTHAADGSLRRIGSITE